MYSLLAVASCAGLFFYSASVDQRSTTSRFRLGPEIETVLISGTYGMFGAQV